MGQNSEKQFSSLFLVVYLVLLLKSIVMLFPEKKYEVS